MIPRDRKLYELVKKEADVKFLAPTSIYKSAWIVREYKTRGGEFEDEPDDNKGLLRWFRERWVNVASSQGSQPCGRKKATTKGRYPLCRPSIRITNQTPMTVSEIPKDVLERAVKQKQTIKNNGKIAIVI